MVELAEMSYRDMVAKGKELGIEGCHEMKKEVLMERLRVAGCGLWVEKDKDLSGISERGATDGGKVEPVTEDTPPEPAEAEKCRYSFPSPVKCPRCGAMDTVAYKTREGKQYRKCRRSICRHKFIVQGDIVN